MATFDRMGKAWDIATIEKRFATWLQRWKNNDPFSAFAIFEKDNNKLIGHAILTYGEENNAGEAKLAYIWVKQVWNQGFGTEAATAVVKTYAPALVECNYKIQGQSFTSITATARFDNPASLKILNKILGMTFIEDINKDGINRHKFFISTLRLCKDASLYDEKNTKPDSLPNLNKSG